MMTTIKEFVDMLAEPTLLIGDAAMKSYDDVEVKPCPFNEGDTVLFSSNKEWHNGTIVYLAKYKFLNTYVAALITKNKFKINIIESNKAKPMVPSRVVLIEKNFAKNRRWNDESL